MSLELKATFARNTTASTRAAMESLLGQSFKVTKGNRSKGLALNDRGTIRQVEHKPDAGFLVTFEVRGRLCMMWATNSARFSGQVISLNTGDPTNNVQLTRVAA